MFPSRNFNPIKPSDPSIDDESNGSASISKQKIVINKDAGIKRKSKLQVAGLSNGDEQSELVRPCAFTFLDDEQCRAG